MPEVKANLSRLAGSTIFSALDMQGAFHCIPLSPEDRPKTAFATPFGQFQQKKLGFGMTNGPAAYCRLVDRILQGLPPGICIGFLDDAVVHSANFDDHLVNLEATLSAYQAAA